MYLLLIPLGVIFAISPLAALVAVAGGLALFAIDRWGASSEY